MIEISFFNFTMNIAIMSTAMTPPDRATFVHDMSQAHAAFPHGILEATTRLEGRIGSYCFSESAIEKEEGNKL